VSQCSEELLKLPIKDLAEILSDDQLNVINEEDVWHCVLRWIGHDTENRKVHVLELMKTVRLGLLDKNFFLEEVSMSLKT
jgi:kelch-like protein 10